MNMSRRPTSEFEGRATGERGRGFKAISDVPDTALESDRLR
jgi:hypothetical protein